MADTRDISMHFWATQAEYDLILQNMELSSSTNLSTFLRKMAIDGMVIQLDMPEIKELLRLLRRANEPNTCMRPGASMIPIWRKFAGIRRKSTRR